MVPLLEEHDEFYVGSEDEDEIPDSVVEHFRKSVLIEIGKLWHQKEHGDISDSSSTAKTQYCKFCDKYFDPRVWNTHFAHKHGDMDPVKAPFLCHDCGGRFRAQKSLNKAGLLINFIPNHFQRKKLSNHEFSSRYISRNSSYEFNNLFIFEKPAQST